MLIPLNHWEEAKTWEDFPMGFSTHSYFPIGTGRKTHVKWYLQLCSAPPRRHRVMFSSTLAGWHGWHAINGEKFLRGGFPPPGLWNGRSIEKPRKKTIVWYFDLLQTEVFIHIYTNQLILLASKIQKENATDACEYEILPLNHGLVLNLFMTWAAGGGMQGYGMLRIHPV